MKRFITIILTVVFVLGISAYVAAQGLAEKQEGTKASQGLNIEEKKAKMISHIDERLKTLQEARTCVEAAKTKDDLKKCMQNIRAEKKELREEMKGSRKKHMKGQ